MCNLFWFDGNNFGDVLNPVLYERITGSKIVGSADMATNGKVLAIGSTMGLAMPGDTVWGTGCLTIDQELNIDETTDIRAVRGPLTETVLRRHGLHNELVYGDPALIMRNYIDKHPVVKWQIGILPHYIDKEKVNELAAGLKNCLVLNIHKDPVELIKDITSCEFIASSSLHGLVIADAFDVPSIWVEFSRKVTGNGFKFIDYYLGIEHSLKSGILPGLIDWSDGINFADSLVVSALIDSERRIEQGLGNAIHCIVRDLLACCPFNKIEGK